AVVSCGQRGCRAQHIGTRAASKAHVVFMSENVKFFMSFRVRLMLLLTSFLLLTIILVLALDKWAQKLTAAEVSSQSEQVKEAVNSGFSDFAKAIGLAINNLNSERYLYRQIQAGEIGLPGTVEHI